MRVRRRWQLALALLAPAVAGFACSLSPQPLPPENASAAPGDAGGRFPLPKADADQTGTDTPPSSSADAAVGFDGAVDLSDAGVDAPNGPTDAGDAGDAAGDAGDSAPPDAGAD